MNKCQAIKKDGVSCAANGCHIVMVWTLNNVAYPQDKLPQLYANHGWALQALNFCGSHRNVLTSGKPVNISSTIPVEVNQPKEGIIMTNNINTQCDICNGTGYDEAFSSPCSCPAQKAKVKVNGPTDSQKWRLAKEVTELKAIMRLEITWATFTEDTTAKEAYDLVALTISIKEMTKMAKAKRNLLSTEQIEKIRTAINNKPTVKWVNDAKMKLAKLS